jgi:hypothetical protein
VVLKTYVSAPTIDEAFVRRCIEVSADDEARDRIISSAIKEASSQTARLSDEIDSCRQGISKV